MTDTIRVRFTEGGGGCLSEVSIVGDPAARTLTLTDLFTHPKLRRKGLAREIVQRAVDWANRAGYDLQLEPLPHGQGGAPRAALQRFYGAYGFRTTRGDGTMVRPCSKSK